MSDRSTPNPSLDSALGFIELASRAARLKTVRRTGWLDRGLDPSIVESVADHSIAVAILAWATALQRQADGALVDPARILKLAILHDLAEAMTGDLPPYDPAFLPGREDAAARREFLNRRHVRDVARTAEKRASENEAMAALLGTLPEAVRGEFRDLWDELRAGTSPEAHFVKQVDRLETFLQSRHYLHESPNLPVESFRREVAETIDDSLLAAIRDAALKEDEPSGEHESPLSHRHG